jgi:hypothetical protein
VVSLGVYLCGVSTEIYCKDSLPSRVVICLQILVPMACKGEMGMHVRPRHVGKNYCNLIVLVQILNKDLAEFIFCEVFPLYSNFLIDVSKPVD